MKPHTLVLLVLVVVAGGRARVAAAGEVRDGAASDGPASAVDAGGADIAVDAGAPNAGDASSDITLPDPTALIPPAPLELPPIVAPTDVPPPEVLLEVEVLLTIDATGTVTAADIIRSGGPAFDREVLLGVKRFRFRPARQGGKPLTVRIPFTQRFAPPAPAAAPPIEAEAPLDAFIEGLVVTRGARTPVAGARIVATDTAKAQPYVTVTDAAGAFRLAVPADTPLEVNIAAPEHERFLQREQLAPHQSLRVRYLVDRRSFGEYQSYVRADADRTEVSRTTLSGREINRVAGTFGDPFRVVSLLPGVTTTMSLLPMPVVRGSSPGNTGILLDGIRLPLLFHLLAGPSVIHPELIDRVDFYPGGFPVPYGGYTGGIVDGVTRAARPDEERIELDLNLTQTGLFVRTPVRRAGVTVTGAGRIGYPGVILSLLSPDASLSYWDYQLRVDADRGAHHTSLFVYGAGDTLKARPNSFSELKEVAHFGFHRLDLRHRHGEGRNHESVRLVIGYDDSLIADDDSNTNFGTGKNQRVPGGPNAQTPPIDDVDASDILGNGTWSLTPQLRFARGLHPTLDLELGAESIIRFIDRPPLPPGFDPDLYKIVNESGTYSASSLYAQVVFQPHPRLRLIPGLRADIYDERRSKAVTMASLDPRLLARLRASETLTLKGVVGRYHQPPRLFIPVPGIDSSSLELGLLASTQYSVGFEARLGRKAELDASVYYNAMDPILFDLVINELDPTNTSTQPSNDELTLDSLFSPRRGRAYGLELLLRKRDSERFFGWISYTLSRSERRLPQGWSPFDFDRLHILNLVTGIRLPRNWEFGARVLYQSGTPLNTTAGNNRGRSNGQVRFDIRIDKRAVWNSWLLDFYVDIINAAVTEESGGLVQGNAIRYLLPTVGFRALL